MPARLVSTLRRLTRQARRLRPKAIRLSMCIGIVMRLRLILICIVKHILPLLQIPVRSMVLSMENMLNCIVGMETGTMVIIIAIEVPVIPVVLPGAYTKPCPACTVQRLRPITMNGRRNMTGTLGIITRMYRMVPEPRSSTRSFLPVRLQLWSSMEGLLKAAIIFTSISRKQTEMAMNLQIL